MAGDHIDLLCDEQLEEEPIEDMELDLLCHEDVELFDKQVEEEEELDLLCHEDVELFDKQVEEEAAPVERKTEEVAAIISSLVLGQKQIEPIQGITSQSRSIIIDSMLGSLNAQLYPRAVHLAVHIFDSYFALTDSPEQLNHETVASLALYIAAKFEYGIKEAQRMTFVNECLILKTIDHRLHKSTTNLFVEAILYAEASPTLRMLCSYIADLSLLDLDCSRLLPSHVAVATIFLGKYIMDPLTRPQVDQFLFLCEGDLRQTVLILQELYMGERFPILRSTRDKNRSLQFECQENIPQEYFD